jgi:uncharacterized protein (DUF433 family)
MGCHGRAPVASPLVKAKLPVPARKIVRDPAILAGRWRLAGTMLPIAEVRNDFYLGHTGPLASYRFAGLTAEDIAAVLAFDFPAIQEPTVELRPASVVVHCACGETTEQFGDGWPETEVDCVCGRCWCVRLTLEPSRAGTARLDLIA